MICSGLRWNVNYHLPPVALSDGHSIRCRKRTRVERATRLNLEEASVLGDAESGNLIVDDHQPYYYEVSLRGAESARGDPYRFRPFTNNYCGGRVSNCWHQLIPTSETRPPLQRSRLGASFASSAKVSATAQLRSEEEAPACNSPADELEETHRRASGMHALNRNQFPRARFISALSGLQRGANQARGIFVGWKFSASFITARALRALLIDACSNSFLYFASLALRPPAALSARSSSNYPPDRSSGKLYFKSGHRSNPASAR